MRVIGKRQIRVWAMAIVLALVATACGDDDTPAATDAPAPAATDAPAPAATDAPAPATTEQQLFKVSHGAAPCCYQQAVEQILKEQEFDKKNGIDLELKVIDLSQLALLLSSGEVDEDFASLPLIVNANLQGNPLQCFAPLNQKFQTFGFVRNDAPYQSLLDLRGEETANIPETTAMYLYTDALLGLQGVDYASELNVTTGPVPVVVELFERGDVELLIVPDPPATSLLASGEYRLIWDVDVEMRKLLDFEPKQNCIASRKGWIDENPERARGVAQMWIDVLNYVYEHPESIEGHAADIGLTSPEEIETAKEVFGGYYGPSAWNDDVVANFQANVEWLLEVGILEELPDEELFVNLFG